VAFDLLDKVIDFLGDGLDLHIEDATVQHPNPVVG
jgi:hypothetical protein